MQDEGGLTPEGIVHELQRGLIIPAQNRTTALKESHLIYMIELALQRRPQRVLEIGLGWGLSAAGFQRLNCVERHVIVEIDEGSERSITGERNVRSSAVQDCRLDICWGDSGLVLPRLCEAGESFDWVLIDGGHRYDDVFVDFHFVRRLLAPRAIVFFDDLWMPSIQTVISWIETNLEGDYLRLPAPAGLECCAFENGAVADRRSWQHFRPFEVSR